MVRTDERIDVGEACARLTHGGEMLTQRRRERRGSRRKGWTAVYVGIIDR